jgi:hypothetical protein
MTLFERIHEVIKKRLGPHDDEETPVDTEALTADVIQAHADHIAENPIPATPDDVVPAEPVPPTAPQPEEKAAEA